MAFSRALICLLVLIFGSLKGVKLEEREDYKDHPCIRQCEDGVSMVCEYNFTVEHYYTLSRACYDCPFNQTDCSRHHCVAAEGTLRSVLTVNRMMPGAAINVCVNDTIVVNVYNELSGGEGTTFHWHGLHVPPFMDGVGMISQCPIPTFTSFQYRFSAFPKGTHLWHAHHGLQNGDGLFGALVVRESLQKDIYSDKYDVDSPEYTVMMNDWTTKNYLETFIKGYHYNLVGSILSQTVLINGKGAFQAYSKDNTTIYTPYETFSVTQGTRYRFRLISNTLNTCPLSFQIDNHTMTIIASDGSTVEPHSVNSLTIYSGERIDVIVKADPPIGNYWMRVSGHTTVCGFAFQLAKIEYVGATNDEPKGPKEWMNDLALPHYDPVNTAPAENYSDISVLNATEPDDEALTTTPSRSIYLLAALNEVETTLYYDNKYYGIKGDKNLLFMPQLNYISSRPPPSPLQTQYNSVPKDMFCQEDMESQNCSHSYCSCCHIIKINLGEVVEFIIVDEGNSFASSHPFHLHGHYFRVIGLEKLEGYAGLKDVQELERRGLLKRRFEKAPLKDSVMVPDGGYTIIRLHAKHPGFWYFHCYSAMHAELGLAVTLQVGSLDEQPPVPKNFPKCGHWKDDMNEDMKNDINEETHHRCDITKTNNAAKEQATVQALLLYLYIFLYLYNNC